MFSKTRLGWWFLASSVAAFGVSAQDYSKLRASLGDERFGDGWIYEDIDAGYAAARQDGKPLLVSFR